GAGADRSCHVLLQPFIEPLCQCHFALFCELHTLERINILPELSCQFFLGICVDISEDGIPVALVAYHDAALPTAVLPFPTPAVAGRPSLSRKLSLLPIHRQASIVLIQGLHSHSHPQPEPQDEVLQSHG